MVELNEALVEGGVVIDDFAQRSIYATGQRPCPSTGSGQAGHCSLRSQRRIYLER